MRVDLNDTDGVIQATCNIPDALWTSSVQTAANAEAAKHGMTLDASDPDDTIDPHVQMVTTQADLVNWIATHAFTALGAGPGGAASAGPSAGEVVVGVMALVGIAALIAWAFHR